MEKNATHGALATPPWIQSIVDYIKTEIHRSDFYPHILSPLVKKILWMLMPYGIGFILLNFFTTILAVGMVIYVHRRYL